MKVSFTLLLPLVALASKHYKGPHHTSSVAPHKHPKDLHPSSPRIVGGSLVGTYVDYQVFVNFKDSYCGGVLIAPNVVLSAAHCQEKVKDYEIITGLYDQDVLRSNPIPDHISILSVEQQIIHPEYSSTEFTADYDVLLLKLSESVENMKPIALNRNANELEVGESLRVFGWGDTSEGGTDSSKLRYVDVKYVSNSECINAYESIGWDDRVKDNQMCAMDDNKDACYGDSGGPLVITEYSNNEPLLVGIVSWAYGCARPGFPGVYARMDYFYDWIMEMSCPWHDSLCSSNVLSSTPTIKSSPTPSVSSSFKPTKFFSDEPTITSSSEPTKKLSNTPTITSSSRPTNSLSNIPTITSSSGPTNSLSNTSTMSPSLASSLTPSLAASLLPSLLNTFDPTLSKMPSKAPMRTLSVAPTLSITNNPSNIPTISTVAPSYKPSISSSPYQTNIPSRFPIVIPSFLPSFYPTEIPTKKPPSTPSHGPSFHRSEGPTTLLSMEPSTTTSYEPSFYPSQMLTSTPSIEPSSTPSHTPSVKPSFNPSQIPTRTPSMEPSTTPSIEPSSNPSEKPTRTPSMEPSSTPSIKPSYNPTQIPTRTPSMEPSSTPSIKPSYNSSGTPTTTPSMESSSTPSIQPLSNPSQIPITSLSTQPTSSPSLEPSNKTSHIPTRVPRSVITPFADDAISLTPSLKQNTFSSASKSPLSYSNSLSSSSAFSLSRLLFGGRIVLVIHLIHIVRYL